MSLQVWLPLNSNLNNQGLSEITTSGTPKYYTNGKMSSQCLDMSAAITGTANGLAGATEWTAAFWYKIDNNDSLSTDWVDVLLLRDETADNSTIGYFRFETCYTSNYDDQYKGLHWHDNSTNATITGWALVSADREVWHHACITVSPTKGIHTYCDGALVHSVLNAHNGGHLTGYFQIGQSNLISGGIQDIRLYDHCLSAKEVAEIAKGLILHYKLDHNGIGGANYINNSGPTAETLWSIPTNWTGSIVECPTAPSGICMRTTASADGIAGGIHRHPWARDTYVDGEIYTLSAYIRCSIDGFQINFKNEMMTSNNKATLSTSWKFYSYSAPIDINATYYSDIFYAWDKTKVTEGMYIEVHSLKFEKGSRATPWCPSSADPIYTELGFDKVEEPDCSGFGNNGTMIGTYTYDSDTPRYALSTVFNGTDTYIIAGTGAKVKDAITVSIWVYMDDWYNDNVVNKIRPISCTQTGGWVFEGSTNGKIAFSIGTGVTSNSYKSAFSTMNRTSISSGWHHLVGTYNGFSVKFYIDGVLQNTNTAYTTKTPIYYHPSNGIFIGCEAASSATVPESVSTHGFSGKISDVRIYSTALTDDQVKELYDSSCSIDNNGNLFCYQIEERSKTSISKYGIWSDKCFSGSIVNQYDPITYVEPDGSVWIRIFHHNDPTNSGLFSSTDSFETSVYLDDNRWFSVALCNYLTSNWELMIKQKPLVTDDEVKYRWIQKYNPMTATYEQVTVDNVTKITTSGYSTHAAYGGLYKHSASTYICASNASSTNWFCAVGCYTLYQSGIPAYTGGAITTGYMDLYLRVDNIETPNFRINAGGTMATDFYEI